MALDGVIGKVDANDIPGENEIIVMWQKEHCDKVAVKNHVQVDISDFSPGKWLVKN